MLAYQLPSCPSFVGTCQPATLHAPHLPPSGTTVVTQRRLRSASLPFSQHLSVSPVRLWTLDSCFVAGVLFRNFIFACHLFAVPKERTRRLELQLLLNRPPPCNDGFHIWSVIPHHHHIAFCCLQCLAPEVVSFPLFLSHGYYVP